MIIILLIGLVLLGTAVALLTRGVIDSRLRTADNLGQIGQYGFAGTPEIAPTGGVRGFFDSAAAGIGQFLSERLHLVNEEHLRKTLISAGMYRTSPRTLIGYQLLFGLALPIAWLFLAAGAGASTALAILAAIFLAAIGWFAPGFIVQRRAESRLHRIDRSMPELIDLLVVSVEAGLSLAAAMQLAGERMQGPLGNELRIVLQEQRMGLSPVQALAEHGRALPDARRRGVRPGDGAGSGARRIGRADPAEPRGRDAQAAPGSGRAAGAESADQDALPARLHDLPGAVRRHPRPGCRVHLPGAPRR